MTRKINIDINPQYLQLLMRLWKELFHTDSVDKLSTRLIGIVKYNACYGILWPTCIHNNMLRSYIPKDLWVRLTYNAIIKNTIKISEEEWRVFYYSGLSSGFYRTYGAEKCKALFGFLA